MYRGSLKELNRQIDAAQAGLERRRRLLARVKQANEQEADLRDRVERHRERLDKERLDVDRLEGKSLTALVAALFGTKEARLDKERREVLVAKLKLDDALAELDALHETIGEMTEEAAALGSARERLGELMADKERAVKELAGPEGDELERLGEKRAPLAALHREMEEALAAGAEAADALALVVRAMEAEASRAPGSRRGGIFLPARRDLPDVSVWTATTGAQQALLTLQRELGDVELPVHEDGGDFGFGYLTTFADLIFDDLVDDLASPGDPQGARATMMNAHERVHLVVEQLQERLDDVAADLGDIDEQRQAILSQWDS